VIRIITAIFLFSFVFQQIKAEKDIYMDMSLEDLYEIEIIESASKKPEDFFEAPLSVTIIKKEDITAAGITSIPEALRLAPGVIVREITPGNFDVHIRGFDDITTNFIQPLPNNSIILVMIDNRIVYDNFTGGCSWEALPIDINDIKRIEIIRGPASALYGPNAMQGVVNIITEEPDEEGIAKFTSFSVGYKNQANTYISLMSKQNNFSLKLSTNFSCKERVDDKYFCIKDGQYVEVDDITSYFDPDSNSVTFDPLFTKKPDKRLALAKAGLNLSLDYIFSYTSKIDLDCGLQRSESQRPHITNFITPLSEINTDSYYVKSNFEWNNFHTKTSLMQGKRRSNFFWLNYDYTNFLTQAEYNWEFSFGNLIPAVSYSLADYESVLFKEISHTDVSEEDIRLGGDGEKIESYSFSLLSDLRFWNRLRLIWGTRTDRYNINSEPSYNGELAITYRISKNNLARFVLSSGTRTPFMVDTFITHYLPVNYFHISGDTLFHDVMWFRGDNNLNYLTNNTVELGWRSKITNNLVFDIETFVAALSDFIVLSVEDSLTLTQPGYVNSNVFYTFENEEELLATQVGFSWQLGYKLGKKADFDIFGTWQNTVYIESEDGFKLTNSESDDVVITNPKISTPQFWMSYSFTFYPYREFVVNLNGYYQEEQNYMLNNVKETYDYVKAFHNFNFKISYTFGKQISPYISGRNVFGKHKEYGFTDRIYPSFMIGSEISW